MSKRILFWFSFSILCISFGCSNPDPQEKPANQDGVVSDASVKDQGTVTDDLPHEGTRDVMDSMPKEDMPKDKPAPQEDKAVKAIKEFIANQNIDKSSSNWKTRLPKPTKVDFDPNRTYYWVIKTNKGTMKLKFMPSVAPMHVTSTIYLTLLGFYDGTIFHRIITNFMAQGGDPLGTGYGGPGYKYDGEYSSSVTHDKRGLLSMANTGKPTTDGSQFFITFVPTPHLNGKHTIFGEVVDGMPVLKAIEAAGSRTGKPTEKITLEKATIVVE